MYKNKPTQLSHDFTLFHPASIRSEAVPISSHPPLWEDRTKDKSEIQTEPLFSAALRDPPAGSGPSPALGRALLPQTRTKPRARSGQRIPGPGPPGSARGPSFQRDESDKCLSMAAGSGGRSAPSGHVPASCPPRDHARAAARAGPGPAEPLAAPPLPGCSGRAGAHPASPATLPEL